MRNWFPFSDYDFYAYITSGFALMFAIDFLFNGGTIMLRPSWPVVQIVLAFALAYVLGQVTAIPAKAIVESLIVHRLLGAPSIHLLADRQRTVWRFMFPEYYEPLPPKARQRVVEMATNGGCYGAGEELFLFARFSTKIVSNELVLGRLSSFLNQYGMHRNLCFTFLLIGMITIIHLGFIADGPDKSTKMLAMFSLVISVGLFYRFLKFYRQYCYEVFNTFGANPEVAK